MIELCENNVEGLLKQLVEKPELLQSVSLEILNDLAISLDVTLWDVYMSDEDIDDNNNL